MGKIVEVLENEIFHIQKHTLPTYHHDLEIK